MSIEITINELTLIDEGLGGWICLSVENKYYPLIRRSSKLQSIILPSLITDAELQSCNQQEAAFSRVE